MEANKDGYIKEAPKPVIVEEKAVDPDSSDASTVPYVVASDDSSDDCSDVSPNEVNRNHTIWLNRLRRGFHSRRCARRRFKQGELLSSKLTETQYALKEANHQIHLLEWNRKRREETLASYSDQLKTKREAEQKADAVKFLDSIFQVADKKKGKSKKGKKEKKEKKINKKRKRKSSSEPAELTKDGVKKYWIKKGDDWFEGKEFIKPFCAALE